MLCEINSFMGGIMTDYHADEMELKKGGKLFEQFWLRPKKYNGQKANIRLRVNTKWGGWKLKDEIIQSLKLEVGNTISTEVTVHFMLGLIDDDDDTDLFASGEAADWLLDNEVKPGTVIDCCVRFVYSKLPIGGNDREIGKISLVFEKGLGIVGNDPAFEKEDVGLNSLDALFKRMMNE